MTIYQLKKQLKNQCFKYNRSFNSYVDLSGNMITIEDDFHFYANPNDRNGYLLYDYQDAYLYTCYLGSRFDYSKMSEVGVIMLFLHSNQVVDHSLNHRIIK